ncbi:hypothetical protein RIR_jg37063.t1 [Rhizophagus irregularis DAOM 181602=DAOM 197198]|uniref:Uncharacterized protein n=1 Tax=Rhizophagus irregularis (strain DAOM 181602 / DAOM 197198 / MUCL 43194) TaxID=747089 RepID=U9UB22_RHIID|nr:hypothetical protein RIR_jg37063.t1 [Rhizophagus irregularis DAOM 181602=DAOM 197198]
MQCKYSFHISVKFGNVCPEGSIITRSFETCVDDDICPSLLIEVLLSTSEMISELKRSEEANTRSRFPDVAVEQSSSDAPAICFASAILAQIRAWRWKTSECALDHFAIIVRLLDRDKI